MDTDVEVAKAKWLLVGGLVFVVSCFICYDELIYLLHGKKAQATVTKIYAYTRTFGLRKSLTVYYTFKEPDGTPRDESDKVNSSWDVAEGETVAVQYTPGKDGRSRLAGHVNWFGIVFFFASLGAMGYFVFHVWRIASEASKPHKGKQKR